MSRYPLSDLGGVYEHSGSENMEAYLSYLGVPQDRIRDMLNVTPVITIIVEGNKISLRCLCKNGTQHGHKKMSSTLVLNEEVEEFWDDRFHFKSLAVFDGIDTLTISSKKISCENKSLKRFFKFNGTDLEVTLVSIRPNGPVGKQFYRKICNNVT